MSEVVGVKVNVKEHGTPAKNRKRSGKGRRSKKVAMNDKVPPVCLDLARRIYYFSRVAHIGRITQQVGVISPLALSFTLSQAPEYTEFTSLFDEYRICALEVTFKPKFNMMTVTSPTAVVTPLLYTAIDYDDATVPASAAELEEYQTCVVTNFNRSVKRTIVPKNATAVYQSTTATSYGVARPWLDCAYASVPYYGLKAVVEGGAIGQVALQAWDISVKYYLEFRIVR